MMTPCVFEPVCYEMLFAKEYYARTIWGRTIYPGRGVDISWVQIQKQVE